MKSSEQSPLLLNCSFLSKEAYRALLTQALTQDSLTHIVTLNAEMVVEAQHNEKFREAVKQAELKIPDGSSLLWARKYLAKISPPYTRGSERGSVMSVTTSLFAFLFSKEQPLTGVDSIFDICEILEKKNGSIYLLGGKYDEANKTAIVLRKKHPRLRVILPRTSPNPSFERRGNTTPLPFTKGELEGVSAIFVALGSPKQTLWIEEHRTKLEQSGIKIAIGVGGAFAMISGTLPRAPYWMRKHHIEWVWRLLLEPKRLTRIWNATVRFPLLIHREQKK